MKSKNNSKLPSDRKTLLSLTGLCLTISIIFVAIGCGQSQSITAPAGVPYAKVADFLHTILENDRTVYTKNVVNRLVKQEKIMKASEHWVDDKALPLPAQMFRMGAEMTAEKTSAFSYSLQSLWPINKSNAAGQTDVEKEGLKFVVDNKGKAPYYGEEVLGDQKYFVGVYADVAVAPVCVSCHNDHKDTPKNDFTLGDVMGGVVIRIPVD